MATVNFIPYKSQSKAALSGVLRYVEQEKKTLTETGQQFISGQNCTPQLALQEFIATREMHRKESPVWFYHYAQSFSPEERIAGKEAHELAKAFSAQAWPESEVLISTHIDAAHIHTHFIVNAVCPASGKMLRQGPNTLRELRQLSDRLCQAHGFSTLKPYEKSGAKLSSREYRAAKKIESWKFQLILSALYDEPFLFLVYTFLAIYTGCRRGELSALRWSDFTQSGDGAILTVSRSRSTVVGKGGVEGKTKNGRSRQIYIEKDVVDIIRSLYYEQEQSSRREGVPLSPYLFANRQGQPIHPDTFTKHLRRLYDDHGFPKEYHLHSLRHYFVSSLLHHGIDKQTVAELAGHGDTSFLERTYCHPQMALKRQAAQVMTADICGTLAKGESA